VKLTKEVLQQDLFELCLKKPQIAEKHNCSVDTIRRYIEKFDLVPTCRAIPIELTQRQRSILIGSVLGDGYIGRKGEGQCLL